MSERKEDITIVLLGLENSGKSSTGSTIAGHESTNFTWTEELLFETKFGEYQNYRLRIFEIPGQWGPEKWKKEGELEQTCKDLERFMNHLNNGYNTGITAFLLVLNITNRFTINNQKMIETFETIFGEKEFWKHSIVVLTKGDVFDGDFNRWVEEQEDYFATVIKNCDRRLVLVSNRKSSEMYTSSREKLISEIITLKTKNKYLYELQNFKNNWLKRNSLIVKSEMAKIEYEFYKNQEKRKRNETSEKDRKRRVKEIMHEKYKLKKADRKTGCLKNYLKDLENEEMFVKRNSKPEGCFIT